MYVYLSAPSICLSAGQGTCARDGSLASVTSHLLYYVISPGLSLVAKWANDLNCKPTRLCDNLFMPTLPTRSIIFTSRRQKYEIADWVQERSRGLEINMLYCYSERDLLYIYFVPTLFCLLYLGISKTNDTESNESIISADIDPWREGSGKNHFTLSNQRVHGVRRLSKVRQRDDEIA